MKRRVVDSGSRLRVVVMVDTLERPGGGERLALENAMRLDPAKYERSLCITRWNAELERVEPAASMLARLVESGVRIVKLRRRSKAALWAWLPLLRLLRRERVEVLHGHLFGSNVWAVIVGRLARVPVVVAHEHIWAYEGNPTRRFLDRNLIARLADAFVAVSEDGRRLMIEHERIDPSDIVVIPNGIAGSPPGDGSLVRAELGIPDRAPVVGSVGNLRPQKAFEILIEAAVELRRRVPEARVLIAGEGPQRERLERLIAERGVEETVTLLGARSDIPDFLAALDVAVCCSDFEGSPLSVMEYMEAGLPIAATRIGGLAELVHDRENGVLVPRRDPKALAEALTSLLGNPGLRTRLGAKGKELRREQWSLDTWISRIEDLYLALRAKSRR